MYKLGNNVLVKDEAVSIVPEAKKKKIVFEVGEHWLDNILSQKDGSFVSSMKILGKPLLVYNIEKLLNQYPNIDHIALPEGLGNLADMIQTTFPSIQVDEHHNGNSTVVSANDDSLRMSLNAALVKSESGKIISRPMVYPWDILKVMNEILRTEVKETLISENSSISELASLKGPCIVEDGVLIDSFSKIVGPIYIGRNSFIGTGSLVRKSMIGSEAKIGFNCEIGRSFLINNNRIAHHDVVLDSILGQNSWLGAFIGTSNVFLNNQTIRYKLGNLLVSTGLQQFGSVIGHDCAIGSGVLVMPGRFIPPNSIIQAGTIFYDSSKIKSH